MTESVKVFARFRPLISGEEAETSSIWTYDDHKVTGLDHSYTFDGIVPTDATQSSVYKKIGQPLVHQVLDGFNACILAFGASGSGKTFTMMGDLGAGLENGGLIPRMIAQLLENCSKSSDADEDVIHQLELSYVEIYQERIHDLLGEDHSKTFKLRERGDPPEVYIEGIQTVAIQTYDQVLSHLKAGDQHRVVADTQMNHRSSRSHAVIILRFTRINRRLQTRKMSRLFLVDLAGSELVERSGVTGQALEEAKKINKSLSTLAHVIQALTTDRSHVPYRDSKLTRILTDALGGNSKTVLLLACSPSADLARLTSSTLGFGQRAKLIRNTPKINEEISIKGYQLMVQQLQAKLQSYESGALNQRIAQLEQQLESLKADQSMEEVLEQKLIAMSLIYEELKAELEAEQSLRSELQALQSEWVFEFPDFLVFHPQRIFHVREETL